MIQLTCSLAVVSTTAGTVIYPEATPLLDALTVQAARAMSRQRMLENLAAQGLPPPPEPMRNEVCAAAVLHSCNLARLLDT